MNIVQKVLLFFLPFITPFSSAYFEKYFNIRNLPMEDGTTNFTYDGAAGAALSIYCYKGKPKHLIHIFESVKFELNITTDDFVQYQGHTAAEVKKHYEERRSIFSWMHMFASSKKRIISVNAFNQSCIGIDANHHYIINLRIIRIDFWRVVLMFLGFATFLTARALSEQQLFYYVFGTFLGIVFSVFTALYWISKLFPKKNYVMLGSLCGGAAMGVFFLNMVWDNAQLLIVAYHTYVFWYIFITGTISFLVCYYFGPLTNPRSKSVIKWILQILASVSIYFASDLTEVCVAIIIGLIIVFYLARRTWYAAKRCWRIRFPRPRVLLTQEQLAAVTLAATRQGLSDMQNSLINSPATLIKQLSRLTNLRPFVNFLAGGPPIPPEQVNEHASAATFDYPGDDETDDDDQQDNAAREPINPPIGWRPAVVGRRPVQQRRVTPPQPQQRAQRYEFSDDED